MRSIRRCIYPGSINTVRLVTLRGDSGTVYLLSAAFRIGNGKYVAHFNSGVAPMDLETGAVTDVAVGNKRIFMKVIL